MTYSQKPRMITNHEKKEDEKRSAMYKNKHEQSGLTTEDIDSILSMLQQRTAEYYSLLLNYEFRKIK